MLLHYYMLLIYGWKKLAVQCKVLSIKSDKKKFLVMLYKCFCNLFININLLCTPMFIIALLVIAKI